MNDRARAIRVHQIVLAGRRPRPAHAPTIARSAATWEPNALRPAAVRRSHTRLRDAFRALRRST